MEKITKRGLWTIIAVLLAAQSLDLLASGLDYFVDGDSSVMPLLMAPVSLGLSFVFARAAFKSKEPLCN